MENPIVEVKHENEVDNSVTANVELNDTENAQPSNSTEKLSVINEIGSENSSVKNEEEQETGKNECEKELDPYAYLQRPGFSSEIFKIEIMNLPKYYGFSELKKFLARLQIVTNKTKTMKNYAFVSFRSEEERDKAMETLKGAVFKGRTLDVRLAKPLMDPLIRKRKAEKEAEQQSKEAKIIEPIAQQVTNKAAPYAGKPYSEQLLLKKKEMTKALRNLTKEIEKANFQALSLIEKQKEVNFGCICEFAEMISSPVIENYRNKCEFTAGVNPESDELTLGFRVSLYKEGSYAVGPISHLAFIPTAMRDIVHVFETHFRASGRKAYNPEDSSGFWRQVLVRINLMGEILAVVSVHPQNLSAAELEDMKNELKKVGEASKIKSLFFQAQGPRKSGEEQPLEHILGSTHLVEKLCELEFSISPLAFFQVNTLAAEVLFNKIADIADINLNTNVLDVCCGTGTIGLALAKKCHQVYGIELVKSAVEDAWQNAGRNGITNCSFVAGKAEEELDSLIREIDAKDQGAERKIVAILDPPRAGLHPRCCQVLRNTERIERLVYISCDAKAAMKSFVDLCRAESKKYSGTPFFPVKAMAVDLFPDTPHCEFILILERLKLNAEVHNS